MKTWWKRKPTVYQFKPANDPNSADIAFVFASDNRAFVIFTLRSDKKTYKAEIELKDITLGSRS